MSRRTLASAPIGTAFCAIALLLGRAAVAAPAAWVVDPGGSKLSFQGAMNGEAFNGTFRRWTAQILFDPKALPASKVAVSIDVASAATGDPDRDQAMPTDDWFAASKFAKASFVSQSFRDLGGGKYQAAGVVTLRGVSRPVVLPFTLAIAGDTARMNGAVVLDRTAFGVGQGQWKTGAVVDTKVTVNVALTAHRTR
jgi:polyisoprenoid-binding protein YceI